ncbi:PAS domain-containing protein [Pseudomonas sp. DCB_AW]|uniref:hybrid sensor histidine kinase/response regulator n=1 Tax=Pseudomonas sp. DCB_AW TaxID=2993596 RepID=UPI00224927B0|nr:PAS domain-containing protein [Pseudomonas sp. DCB_AW]MCX2686347.1 PAS domain-containing protein [Pseudomonas sp. DCB_AW]
MPSRDLLSLRQHVEDLERRNALLESQLASHQEHDQILYRSLFDTMDEGFCIIEFFDGPHGPLSDYVHVVANAAYAKHAGIPNVVGQKLREMVPDEADVWVARYGEVLRTGEPLHFEQELVATGHVLSVTTFRVEPAERRQVAVLFKDVTERRRAELALQRLNEELEQRVSAALAERQLFAELVEHSLANVHMIDSNLRWLAINRQAKLEFHYLYGATPEVGDSVPALMGDNLTDLNVIMPMWQRALAGEQFTITQRFGKGAAQRHYELRFNCLRDPDGAILGAYLFAYDISERVAAQQRLLNAEEALRHAQKMEAVGHLSGGIAHDFNNLLGSILAAQELMQQRLQQARHDQLGSLLDVASGAAQRAAAVVHRLLAFSRQQTLQPQPTDVTRLVNGMEQLVRGSIGPSIQLHSHFPQHLWPTFIDPPQLENALLNLCINARDALPEGGAITLSGDNLTLDLQRAQGLDLAAGDYLRLGVKDNGRGMSAEVAARAVDPFFTTKPMGQGTGLGLSMVYGFVRQSGGQMRILSKPDEGTLIELYLPRHLAWQAMNSFETPAQLPASGNSLPTGQIVLVEDQEPLRLVIREVLEELGHDVQAFADGPSALAYLEQCPPPHLLITDIGLPGGLNGRQVADRCRVLHPHIKVLFITGYDESAVLSHGQPLEASSVLTKPFDLAALVERVAQLLMH